MRIQLGQRLQLAAVLVLSNAIGFMVAATPALAQNSNRPWMNSSLSPEARAELVLIDARGRAQQTRQQTGR